MSVVCVSSGKGSPGATFVASNLAAALARAGEEVLLLDLDPAGGDLCCYLGLDPRRGLYPLVRMEGGIPGPERFITEAEERAGFLAVCGFPEASDLASPELLASALRAGRAAGRTVVADLGRASDAVGAVAAEADRVVLVVRPDLVSVLGAERALRSIESSVAGERIGVVVSGVERRRSGDLAEVREALRLPALGSVPLDRKGARKALLAQAPAETKRLMRAFEYLALALDGGEMQTEPERLGAFVEPVEVRA